MGDPRTELTTARLRLTLAQARALGEDPPVQWAPKMQARFSRFLSAQEQHWVGRQRASYERAAVQLKENHTRVEATIAEQMKVVAQVQHDVEHGRMSSSDAFDRLRVVSQAWQSADAILDSVEADQTSAIERLRADPADLEAEMGTRFPNVPVGADLTEAYLSGDDNRLPFDH